MTADAHYEVQSSDRDKVYSVYILSDSCSQKPNCIPQCHEHTCSYLCRHMMKCTCIDYVQGHLCKHVHKVCQIFDIEILCKMIYYYMYRSI